MTPLEIALGIAVGFVSGVLSGLFGVGGGIVMTPGLQVLLDAAPIVALATPLPVILPTALTGALTYRRAGELDERAAVWMIGPGVLASILGALLTRFVDTHVLLAIVALVIPGTITHAALGHIDWALVLVVTIGAVPGALIGAKVALGTHEHTLRILVGGFLLIVAIAYGVSEALEVLAR